MQTNDCRLDQVVLTFARLYRFFDAEKEPEDAPLRDAVLKSLEKRWAKADQDVFIAATICNPFSMAGPFVLDENYFSYSAVGRLMKRLWTRFFPGEDPHTLYNDTKAYLRGTEGFASMKETMESIRAATPVDPVSRRCFSPQIAQLTHDVFLSEQVSHQNQILLKSGKTCVYLTGRRRCALYTASPFTFCPSVLLLPTVRGSSARWGSSCLLFVLASL